MQAQTNRVEYDLIVNELAKGLKDHTSPVVQACGFHRQDNQGNWHYQGPDTWYFREYRTIGFTVTRQMGKSSWLADKIAGNSTALAVVRDDQRAWFYEQFFQDYAKDVADAAVLRVLTIAEVKKRIAKGTLEKYETYYVDDANHSYHFFMNDLHRYFIDTNHLTPTIILVG